MRLLHFNILNGFNNGTIPLRGLTDYLKLDNIDTLLLNEYRSSSELDGVLSSLGYSYSVVNSLHHSTNRAAIFSRAAIDEVVCVPENMRLVWVKINNLNLVSYHASPCGVEEVEAEVKEVIAKLEGTDRVVVAGDFNSLSRHDDVAFGYSQMAGSSSVERYSKRGGLSFSVLEMFEQAGLIDQRNGRFQNTVPTALFREHENGATLRLDYVLSRNGVISNLEVLQDAPFRHLSDHFPISFQVRPF